MPKVSISHKSSLLAKDAFSKIKNFFENDEDIRRFDPKMKCEFTDQKMTGKATGSQFKADISVSPQEASQETGSLVSVVIDLPLLMTPFKGKVQEIIQKKLNKYLV